MIIKAGPNLTYKQCLLVGIDPEFGKADFFKSNWVMA